MTNSPQTASGAIATPHSPVGCKRFIAKLSAASKLSDEEQQAFADLCQDARIVPAKRDLISDGDKPDHFHIVLDGWLARYKVLDDGSRQITAFLLPGDIGDLHGTILNRMDHGIVALTRAQIAHVPHQVMQDLPINRPDMGRALWRATLIDEAILRSWIVNIGRRCAEKRIAHLFCELHARLSLVGLVQDHRFTLPLTQEVIGDALGLTAVHVNRTLQVLRERGVIVFERGTLKIEDVGLLAKIGGFRADYLHPERLRRA